jgi:hypothetical protein
VVIVDLTPRFLSWDEVDPSRHPFDPSSAAQVVDSLGPAQCVSRRPEVSFVNPEMSTWDDGEGKLWADARSHSLAERHGQWAVGWRWAHDERDFDGGPVGNWCCPQHSITTPQETLARVVAALCEWRAWLESLAGWFEAYPLEPTAVADQRILWEQAARNLIWQVVDRTGHGSGWHGHCAQVLTWFLHRWHVAADVAQALVAEAIGGRFHSWTSPETVLPPPRGVTGARRSETMDVSRALPAESQWDLLDEYGLNAHFDAAWIDTEDIEEIAKRFRADPSSGDLCELNTAFHLAIKNEQETLVWIGTHSPGWSVALSVSGGFTFREGASAGGRGIIRYWHAADLGEIGDDGMLYYHDGELMGMVGVQAFEDYARDLDTYVDFQDEVESYLILAGRITGRFLDRDWFTAPRVLYRIPKGAWPRSLG